MRKVSGWPGQMQQIADAVVEVRLTRTLEQRRFRTGKKVRAAAHEFVQGRIPCAVAGSEIVAGPGIHGRLFSTGKAQSRHPISALKANHSGRNEGTLGLPAD